jgi:hypothetical protein
MAARRLHELLNSVEVALMEIKCDAIEALDRVESVRSLDLTGDSVSEEMAKKLHAIGQQLGLPPSGGDVVEALRRTLVLWREAEAIVASLALLTEAGRCRVCAERDGACYSSCLGAAARYYINTRGSRAYAVQESTQTYAGKESP